MLTGCRDDTPLDRALGGAAAASSISLPPSVRAIVEQSLRGLRQAAVDHASRQIDLMHLSATDRASLDAFLGGGQMAATISADLSWRLHRTDLPGLWRVMAEDDSAGAAGACVADYLEIADIPDVVRDALAALQGDMPPFPQDLPDGVLNAPALIEEIRHRAATHDPANRNVVVNLMLVPLSADDRHVIDALLGTVPLGLACGAYGTCRLTATRVRGVWRLRHYDITGAVIVDTIEIGDVPQIARVMYDDIDRAADRLVEKLETGLA